MSKIVKNLSIAVLVLLICIFILSKLNFFGGLKNIFSEKAVTIDNTPIIIKEINALASLLTITYTDEIVKDSAKSGTGFPTLSPLGAGAILRPPLDRLVIIGRGKVIAGTDLKKLGKDDITINGDSIEVVIPHSQILETILNPSDFEVFDEKGDWNEQAVKKVKTNIRDEINKRAGAQGILKMADERSSMILTQFLRSSGFKEVEIRFDQAP